MESKFNHIMSLHFYYVKQIYIKLYIILYKLEYIVLCLYKLLYIVQVEIRM